MTSNELTETVTPPAPPKDGRALKLWIWVAAGAVMVTLGALVAGRLLDFKRDVQQMRQRSEELSAQHVRDVGELRDFEDRLQSTARRTEQLEQQLTVFAGRDPAADAELRRLREQSVLTETDELLTLASSQLQVSHDPAAAAAALATADARLARLPRTQFFPLREALARDIERLRKAPSVDTTGVAIRLDRLVQGVDSWHLLSDPTRRLAAAGPAPAPQARGKPETAPAGRMNSIGREFGDVFRDLVRIRTVEAPESLLLPADQQLLLREHLRVRLLSARQAMLLRNEALFRSDLVDTQSLISRYFDASDPLVAAAGAQIKALAATAVDVPLPTLDDSLAALRLARPLSP